jgi:sorbitol-specific phosphotransferase system component IIA
VKSSPKKFQAVVVSVKDMGREFLCDYNKVILFNGRLCPPVLEDICTCHKLRKALKDPICHGDFITITQPGKSSKQEFVITKVGNVVFETLSELGHCTIAFSVDGEDIKIMPGELLANGKPKEILVNDVITIWSGEMSGKMSGGINE